MNFDEITSAPGGEQGAGWRVAEIDAELFDHDGDSVPDWYEDEDDLLLITAEDGPNAAATDHALLITPDVIRQMDWSCDGANHQSQGFP